MVLNLEIIGLHRGGERKFVANQPVAIGKLHLGKPAFRHIVFQMKTFYTCIILIQRTIN
ncbi:hypothetical protein D3C73_1502450 [compost metagenome]